MLSKITLKLKSKKTGRPLEFVPGQILVVVGPNGSGKSMLLRELRTTLSLSNTNTDWQSKKKILDQIVISPETIAWLVQYSLHHSSPSGPMTRYETPLKNPDGKHYTLSYNSSDDNHDEHLSKWAASTFHIYRDLVVILQGTDRQRILTNNTANPGLKDSVPLYDVGHGELNRNRFSTLLAEALKLYPAFDFRSGRVELRLSEREVPSNIQMAATDAAQAVMEHLPYINEFSDGHQALAALYLACTANQYRLLLVDETEAYLHPPLQRLVGQRLASLASENEGTLIAVTHSDIVLEGCLSTGLPLTILRLNNEGGKYSAEVLDPETVRYFINKPILRATSALEALFCQTAVVCEGESDYVVYSEINHRLGQAKESAVPDCKFISTFGKDKVHHVIKPLRQMGIPAAAVCDFDLLTGKGFPALMEAANMPTTTHRHLRDNAGKAIANLPTTETEPTEQEAERKKLAKNRGLGAFTGNDHILMRDLLHTCAQYGVFICPVGEIEQWYPTSTTKERFVSEYFDYLGDDPANPNYKRPATDGIWQFMREIAVWTKDPNRKGMPYDKDV